MGLLIFCMFAALTNIALGQNHPSFRSSWNAGGKPILRIGRDESVNGPGVDKEKDPGWLVKLRSGISKLVTKYGYDGAKPYIKDLVEATEDKERVLLRVQVDRDGQIDAKYKAYGLRSNDPPPTPPPDPDWLRDFKVFIKNLITRYGKENFDEHMRPVISYIEKLHGVHIKDIDGEVFVSYVQKPGSILPKIIGKK